MIQVDLSGIPQVKLARKTYEELACKAYETLVEQKGAGGEFTGWLRLPACYDKGEFSRIQEAAAQIRKTSQALVVVGIGGSYLGSRAVTELLQGPDYNLQPKNTPDIFYVGNGLSSEAILHTIAALGDRDFSLNVISKSGSTTEPAIAFRLFRKLLQERYGREADSRIYVTTDKEEGALKVLAQRQGYTTFSIPRDVGGRYSVLTAVGLLPVCACGVDISQLLEGAAQEMEALLSGSQGNPAVAYAAARQWLYSRGMTTEVLAAYEPGFSYMAQWWKQLFGESEGKGGGGIFPASVELTADLHSLGQYLQDGMRNLMETVVYFEKARRDVPIPYDQEDLDGLNYLASRPLSQVNRTAMEATKQAHIQGGVPVMEIQVPDISERSVGALLYFFQFACGISAYMAGVNPFDQPGVEAYKRNLFTMLGRPGYGPGIAGLPHF